MTVNPRFKLMAMGLIIPLVLSGCLSSGDGGSSSS